MDDPFSSGAIRRALLVERYLSDVTPERLARLAADTRAAVDSLPAEGVSVTYLGSTAIPDEETCFCLFLTDTPSALERVNAVLTVRSLRTVSVLSAGHGQLLLPPTPIHR